MENEIFERAPLSFSTADADIVSLENGEYLKLTIIDWKENKLQIIFDNVLAFNYQLIASNNYRNDEIYSVNDSKWLKEQLELYYIHNPRDKLGDIKHYKLCFNNYNTELNVLCSHEIMIREMEK
jgi:hypothetical protein